MARSGQITFSIRSNGVEAKLAKFARSNIMGAIEDANREIADMARKMALEHLLDNLVPGRADGRGDGKTGIRAALKDPAIVGPQNGGWASGFILGRPQIFEAHGAQDYWRAIERGTTALVGKTLRGWMLSAGGTYQPNGTWASGNLAANRLGGRKRGSLTSVRPAGAKGNMPDIKIKNPIRAERFLALTADELKGMKSDGTLARIYRKHLAARGVISPKTLARISETGLGTRAAVTGRRTSWEEEVDKAERNFALSMVSRGVQTL